MTMGEIGDLLVGVEAVGLDSWQMADELREIQDEFIRDRDAEHSYLRMGFLCAKAIKCCRQLEGDLNVHAGDRGGGPAAAVRAGGPAAGPLAQPRSTPAYPPEAPTSSD
jgi:hypothetical protein